MSDLTKYTDSELHKMLKGSRIRSEEAFQFIYNKHSQRIYAYCLRVTGHPEEANDIFQEAFYKFYHSIKKMDDVTNIGGLLLTITRNLSLNYNRDKKSTFNIEDYNFSTYDDSYENKELLDLISKSLELLDFGYREIFVLRQYQGLSYKEIAEITGSTVSGVKNKFWRAKERIKEILEPYLIDIENNI